MTGSEVLVFGCLLTWQDMSVRSHPEGVKILKPQDSGAQHNSVQYIVKSKKSSVVCSSRVLKFTSVFAVPPSIENQKTNFVVVRDRDIILPCRANGLPPPKITWLKNGQELPTYGTRYRMSRSGWLAIPITR